MFLDPGRSGIELSAIRVVDNVRGLPDPNNVILNSQDSPANPNEAAVALIGNPTDVVTNGTFDADTDWTKGDVNGFY